MFQSLAQSFSIEYITPLRTMIVRLTECRQMDRR